MTEEQVTKNILRWLIDSGWTIVCYDFPQSGTGRFLHPNDSEEKNKESINPDVIAVKEPVCVFFENKDRYYYPDFEKVNSLITRNNYTQDISELLSAYNIENIYYGIGFPKSCFTGKVVGKSNMVDFIVGASDCGGAPTVLHSVTNIF